MEPIEWSHFTFSAPALETAFAQSGDDTVLHLLKNETGDIRYE